MNFNVVISITLIEIFPRTNDIDNLDLSYQTIMTQRLLWSLLCLPVGKPNP